MKYFLILFRAMISESAQANPSASGSKKLPNAQNQALDLSSLPPQFKQQVLQLLGDPELVPGNHILAQWSKLTSVYFYY